MKIYKGYLIFLSVVDGKEKTNAGIRFIIIITLNIN